MGNPLTWRNVSSSDFGDVIKARALSQAQSNSAFSGVEDVVKQAQNIENANYTQTGVNNAETLRAMLYGAKTPEAMQALQSSGDYERARASMGSNISNPEALNALADGRLGKLQGQAVANQQYTDQQTDIAGRPVVAGYMSGLAQATKADTVKSLMESIQTATGAGALDPRLAAQLTEKALSRSAAVTAEERAAAAEAQNVLKRPLEIQKLNSDLSTAKTSRAASEAQTTAAIKNSEIAAAALEDRRKANEAALRQASNTAALKDTMYQDGVYSNNDAPELIKLMTDSGIGHDVGERNAIIKRLTELQAKGIDVETDDGNGKKVKTTVPLSKSAVKAALLGADDEWFNSYNQGWANNIENSLRKALTTTRIDKIDGKPFVKSDAVDGYLLYQELLRNNIENPVVANPKGNKSPKQ